ncbi:prepilin-type N-terminal cleavage/methylation domain-containing protein [Levilactobacillus enshiensis]|uniref:prepilin-type N-terminal cleavage/methylation domain-containing protein n=1 Tax=Levilactobacillus enshiensis TaxID=2590213 RepID=UPI00117AF7C0|nr:prepilin-type N-terminal cleavage/methylation domain-containing protein [Levilactobacillus enshiensis]
MTSRRGFTLIETLFALMITAGMFLLVTGTDHALTRGVQSDALAWLQMVQVLEKPGKYQVVRTAGDVLVVKDHDKRGRPRKMKVLLDRKGVLKLAAMVQGSHAEQETAKIQGYYPLLRQVTAIRWQNLGHGVVKLRLKQENLPWRETLVDLRGIKGS